MRNTVLYFLLGLFFVQVNAASEKFPVSECTCGRKQHACATTHVTCTCIPIEWKCDGDNDCGDESDEIGCTKTCPFDHFRCPNGICIPNKWLCDGANDCGDDSDEISCLYPCDEATEKQCERSRSCINKNWWCDGDEDCEDGSDESHCELPTCAPTDFTCDNKECIIQEWRCDEDFDCRDGSDEDKCNEDDLDVVRIVIGSNVTCTDAEFACKGGYGQCVREEYVCDGDQDCSDGSDELLCDIPCLLDQFRCQNDQCIPLTSRCDEFDDCGDGSDEIGCLEIKNDTCMQSEFLCSSGMCISWAWRCDGDQDCDDNSDEANCDVESCSSEQFQCAVDHRCIRLSWRCDGEPDCMDGSDEKNCDICETNQFRCLDGRCVGIHKKCDGHPDCGDRSDEPPIQNCEIPVRNQTITSCSNDVVRCDHICRDTSRGAVCTCRRGFKLSRDGFTCSDINECVIESSCSQICVNTNGSYTCSCLSGYSLRHDGRTCKATGPEPSLLFANRIDIRQMQPGRSELKPILRDLENAIALDYHTDKELMFWSDVTLDLIKSSFLNGSNVKEIVTTGLESPGGIAVDWIHDLLYWTDSGTSRVEVSQLDGSFRKVLIWAQLEKPRAIAVHPLESLMFWTDWGSTPRVESAWMDGNGRKTIASGNMYWPNGLTIDYTRNHVYWVDAKHHIIERVNTDGQNRKPVISRGLQHPFSITLFEDKLYWTDWETKSINTANKFTGSSMRTIRNRLHFPMGIQTYHPLRQPRGNSKCKNNKCSQLCLPKPSGHTCACQTGFQPINATHCAEEINKFLIFARKSDIRRISYDADNHSDTVLPLKKIQSAIALDWDSEYPGYIYWSDVGSDKISRAHWDGSHQQEIISSSLDSPAGIAVDWVNDKLYWTDAGLNRIEVSMLDGSLRCVLIWTDLDRPRDILVHPKRGYLFWSDWGLVPKIERSSMNGASRVAIITQRIESPNGLAFDFVDQRLFWADGGRKTIESSDIHGRNRKLVISDDLPHPFGLAVHDSTVYWTDWSRDMIQSADKYTGKHRKVLRENLGYLMDIQYYYKSRPVTPNPCKNRNGNCSHLCLLAQPALPLMTSPSFSCACPTGFALGKDGKVCNSHLEKFLLIARRTDLRVISLDVAYSADVKLPLQSNLVNVIDVDIDPLEEFMYWSDIGARQIARSNLYNLHTSETILKAGLGTVDGIVIDSIERKLYWTDADRKLISVSELDGTFRKTLVRENMDSPRAIVLHHDSGYLYWSDWGSTPKIERCGMDGTNRSVIVSANLMWPNGLTIDHEMGILIWGDAHTELIECSDLTGGRRRTLRVSVPHPYSLTALGGFLYWTDWQTRNVERLNLRNISEFLTVRKNLPNLMGLKAISADKETLLQRIKTSQRCRNNGGCSHLCLRSPTTTSGYRCACPTGIKLQKDAKSCNSLPDQFLLFTSRNAIRRISFEADTETYVELPVAGLENVIAIDYHYSMKKIFFTDVFSDVIRSTDMDGSNQMTVVEGNLRTMDGIAVDWIANHLYWTDTGTNSISMATLDGRKRKVLIQRRLDEPRAICLLPTKGMMYWTDWGQKPRIESAFLDGSSRKILIAKDTIWPNGLTIDSAAERLFWVEAHSKLQRIESCDLFGKNRRTVIANVLHGFSLTFVKGYLYWTDWQTHSVEGGTVQGANRSRLLADIDGLMDIKAVSADLQTGTNLCDVKTGYGNCTDLCLMRGPDSFVCVSGDVVPKINSTVISKGVTSRKPTDTPTTSVTDTGINANGNKVSYLLGFMVALLILVVVGVTLGLILICRKMTTKRQRTQKQGVSTKVSFRNPGYSSVASSRHTLSTGVSRPSPKYKSSKWNRGQGSDKNDCTAAEPILPIGDDCDVTNASPTRENLVLLQKTDSSAFVRREVYSSDEENDINIAFNDPSARDSGLGNNNDQDYGDFDAIMSIIDERPYRANFDKQPKISVATTTTILSNSSESEDLPNVQSSTTSSSRVSTPDVLTNFMEDGLDTTEKRSEDAIDFNSIRQSIHETNDNNIQDVFI